MEEGELLLFILCTDKKCHRNTRRRTATQSTARTRIKEECSLSRFDLHHFSCAYSEDRSKFSHIQEVLEARAADVMKEMWQNQGLANRNPLMASTKVAVLSDQCDIVRVRHNKMEFRNE